MLFNVNGVHGIQFDFGGTHEFLPGSANFISINTLHNITTVKLFGSVFLLIVFTDGHILILWGETVAFYRYKIIFMDGCILIQCTRDIILFSFFFNNFYSSSMSSDLYLLPIYYLIIFYNSFYGSIHSDSSRGRLSDSVL